MASRSKRAWIMFLFLEMGVSKRQLRQGREDRYLRHFRAGVSEGVGLSRKLGMTTTTTVSRKTRNWGMSKNDDSFENKQMRMDFARSILQNGEMPASNDRSRPEQFPMRPAWSA